jgi:hypothetical protein
MIPFWHFVLPGMFLVLAGLAARWAVRLQFFSRSARDLDQIDIPNEVREIRINEFEMLVSDEADFSFKHAWQLTRPQGRQAVTWRLREARKWLHLLIANAALFQEIARFHIQAAASADPDSASPHDLHFRVMDRAAMVHLMAATCLAKLTLIDLCHILWPTYVPKLAGRFQVRGHDLIEWYRHLAKEILELAQKSYDDITYTRFIFQLTGLSNIEEASRLNRL